MSAREVAYCAVIDEDTGETLIQRFAPFCEAAMTRPWTCDFCMKDAVTEAEGRRCETVYAVCLDHAREYRALGWRLGGDEADEAEVES